MNITKNSKEVMTFFYKNNQVNYIRQSKSTKNILNKLYDNILEGYNYIKNQNVTKPVVKKK